MCYARQYASILTSLGIPNDLLQLSHEKRLNAMKSLTALSKYLGCYPHWQEIRKRYSLKWSNGNESLQAFERFFNEGLSIDIMLQRINEMMRLLPTFMAKIIKFACLIGLRPSEVVESVRLLNAVHAGGQYYNPERQALEHFRFPEIFIRQTKKAYISFVIPEMLEVVNQIYNNVPSYNAIRLPCQHRGINMDMRYCRKIFASWLRKEGIQPEVIDLLQGRVSQSILTRHYLAPAQSMKDDVLKALEKLQRQLQ